MTKDRFSKISQKHVEIPTYSYYSCISELIARLTGFDGDIVWDTSKPNGQPRRGLDVSRAKEYFGFEAEMPFEEGLRRTIDWFKEYQNSIA